MGWREYVIFSLAHTISDMDTRLPAFHLTYTYNTRNNKSIIFSVVTKQLENTMYRIAKKTKTNERKGMHLA
jgi:hypothetical protein